MRYIKIKIDVTDNNYIYLHRELKKHLDKISPWYQIKSWKFIEESETYDC